jgi:uncharacterized damage-inducible protein DinB
METFSAPDHRSLLYNGGERAQLESWLDYHRETLLWKCDELDIKQMKLRPIATSDLSLMGLIRHMTFVEQAWFDAIFSGVDVTWHYKQPGGDGDFRNLDDCDLEQVLANYHHAINRSKECAQDHDLNELAAVIRHGNRVDLRWIYVHMIEEYARHCGHADILRELIDGETGS